MVFVIVIDVNLHSSLFYSFTVQRYEEYFIYMICFAVFLAFVCYFYDILRKGAPLEAPDKRGTAIMQGAKRKKSQKVLVIQNKVVSLHHQIRNHNRETLFPKVLKWLALRSEK